MVNRRLIIGAVCLAGLATALIAEQQAANPATEQNTAAQPQPAAQNNGVAPNGDEEPIANASPDQKFITCAAHNNLFEIQAGKLVAGKVENDRVKKIAQMMVDNHTKANDQLKQVAEKSNLREPERLLAWQQAKLDYMAKLPAEELATGYSFHLVGAHHMAILGTQNALTKVQDAGVKELAQNQLRELRSHLQQANSVAMQFTGGQASISGEPVSPDNSNKNGAEQNNPSK
jgi:putative membrane protein